MVCSMRPFELPESRLNLLYCLQSRGFSVRMHAYEYILIYKKRLFAIILLELEKAKATIIVLPSYNGDAKHPLNIIRECIKSIERRMDIVVVYRGAN